VGRADDGVERQADEMARAALRRSTTTVPEKFAEVGNPGPRPTIRRLQIGLEEQSGATGELVEKAYGDVLTAMHLLRTKRRDAKQSFFATPFVTGNTQIEIEGGAIKATNTVSGTLLIGNEALKARKDFVGAHYPDLLRLHGDEFATPHKAVNLLNAELALLNQGTYSVVEDDQQGGRFKVLAAQEDTGVRLVIGDGAYQQVQAVGGEIQREIYSKRGKAPTGADDARGLDYVLDRAAVPGNAVFTRRFAYVEKNYYHLMDLLAGGGLAGRYQRLRAAAQVSAGGAGGGWGKRPGTSASRPGVGDLKLAELAFHHVKFGNGYQQRGVSLTSTPRTHQVYSNGGDLFREKLGVRLKIDLARVPKTVRLMNHHGLNTLTRNDPHDPFRSRTRSARIANCTWNTFPRNGSEAVLHGEDGATETLVARAGSTTDFLDAVKAAIGFDDYEAAVRGPARRRGEPGNAAGTGDERDHPPRMAMGEPAPWRRNLAAGSDRHDGRRSSSAVGRQT
jgi:hypothetical protein